MQAYTKKEKDFLTRAVLDNLYPNTREDGWTKNANDIIIGEATTSGPLSFVNVAVSIHSHYFADSRNVYYEKFQLADFMLDATDAVLSIPHESAVDSKALLRYLNEIYLSSVNARVTVVDYDIFYGRQFKLEEQSLRAFTVNQPQKGDTLLIAASPSSFLFSGFLKILFV